jgi:hypothetical protein
MIEYQCEFCDCYFSVDVPLDDVAKECEECEECEEENAWK